MTARGKGIVVAVAHVLVVSSLGGKLLYDRATCPRVWARSAPYDPDLPIRGRYVRLRLQAENGGLTFDTDQFWQQGRLIARDGRLVAVPAPEGDETVALSQGTDAGRPIVTLDDPVAYFIPEHVPDPSRRADGEELWVEVTLPRRGPPRPIRLGVKRGAAAIVPLDLD